MNVSKVTPARKQEYVSRAVQTTVTTDIARARELIVCVRFNYYNITRLFYLTVYQLLNCNAY